MLVKDDQIRGLKQVIAGLQETLEGDTNGKQDVRDIKQRAQMLEDDIKQKGAMIERLKGELEK